MSELQLERSVLEAKEREELFTIAGALGTKPTSRARKSDLISQILRATGIEPAEAESDPVERPRRTRARKAAPVEEDSQQTLLVEEEQAARAPVAPVGRRRAATTRSTAAPRDGTVRPEADPELDVATAAAAVSPPEPRDVPSGGVTAGSPEGAGGTDPVVREDGAPQLRSSRPALLPSGQERERPIPPRPVSGRDRQILSATTVPELTAEERLPADPGDSRQGGGEPRYVQERPGQGLSPRPGSGLSPGQDLGLGQGPGQPRGDVELGNRRNRRRRGRERGDRPERDVSTPGAPDVAFQGEPVAVSGFLDMRDEGYGFLRTNGFLASPNDVYVSVSQVRRFSLRKGDFLEGASRPAGGTEKYPALLRVDTVGGMSPDDARNRPRFEDLTPLFPDSKLRLEMPGDSANMTARMVDLIAPIGKGQRGLIVSPPKAGKTTVLKQIAHSIGANNPEVHLMVLLIDERPEEVTDMRRSVKGEVISSTFDRPAEEHTQVAELAIERARRLVEVGRDVVIVLDGITRLARAYNLAQPASGRIMSGGIDTGALYPPKKFFGAARNIEEGGSLTILATALVETGSRMDEVIFEEFKGTGNMELRLDRRLAERRLYPALDVNGSSTRHEELLFDRKQLEQVWKLRRVLNALASEGSGAAGLELLMERIKSTRSNDEFLAEIAKTPIPAH
jgi:transcription termination factor Rho